REGRRGADAAHARLGGLHAAVRGRGVRAGSVCQLLHSAASGSVPVSAFEPGAAQRRERGVLQESRGRPCARGRTPGGERGEEDRAVPPGPPDRRRRSSGGFSLERRAVLGSLEDADGCGDVAARSLSFPPRTAGLETDSGGEMSGKKSLLSVLVR